MILSRETQNLIDRVESIVRRPVQVEYDESFRPFEGVSRVATPETPRHRVIVKDATQESVIWHEIGHLERMMWTPPEFRRVVFLTRKSIEDLVSMGFAEILNGIVGQIHRTVRNTIPDILIEHRMLTTAPPHVLAQQKVSFELSTEEQIDSCVELAQTPYYKNIHPFVIMLGSYALFGGRIAHCGLEGKKARESGYGAAVYDNLCLGIQKLKLPGPNDLWTDARNLLTALQDAAPRHEGDDCTFMDNWLSKRDVEGWFFWDPIEYDLPYLPDVGLLDEKPATGTLNLELLPNMVAI